MQTVVFSSSRYFYFYFYSFFFHLAFNFMNKLECFGPACLKIIGFLLCAKMRREGFSPKLLPIHCSILWQREYLLWPRHKPRHTWLSWLTFVPLRFGIASETLGQTRGHEKNIIPLACNICVLFFPPFPFCFVSFNLFFLSMYTVYFFVIYREITKFRLSAG